MHELIHVKQYKELGKLGFLIWYFILPLPVLFSGRWWLEREAYLIDLDYYMSKGYTKKAASKILADGIYKKYLWPYPKSLMQKYFENI